MDTLAKTRGSPEARNIPLHEFLPRGSPMDMAVQSLRQFERPPAPRFAPMWARRSLYPCRHRHPDRGGLLRDV